MILAGDIGGTNTRLCLFDDQLNMQQPEPVQFPSGGGAGLGEIVRQFLSGRSIRVDRACFAVAGPVSMGRVSLTNLNWTLDEKQLEQELGIPRVALINDLVGHAEGIGVLTPERVITLHAGQPVADGNRAIIAAGTGLGEAGLVFDRHSGKYRSFATEGGHCDFAPRNDREDALLKFLRSRFGNVSFETVLSGPGIRNLYEFVVSLPEFASQRLPGDPQPPEITAAALGGANPAAVEAMNLFVGIYGAEAGNLALKTLATGGVWLGGGIAAKIERWLRQPVFLESFRNHSVPKIQQMLAKIPVHVITFEMNGLFGAANYARSL